MSQFYFNIPVYDPISFGYPYQTGEPQVTEPFWQQYPSWTQPDQFNNYNQIQPSNNYYRYNMDTEPLVIGYNTKNGRKIPEHKKNSTGQPNREDKPRAKGKVDVYINGVFIQVVPLSLLVRFSTTAQDAFPKPGKKAEGSEEKESTVRNWADDEGDEINVEKLTSDMAKLKQPSETGNATTSASKVACFEPPVVDDHGPNKKFDVNLESLWMQPPLEAFKFAFDWMYEARRTSNGEAVLAYGVPDPNKLPLSKLVDLYAAALCLRLRPPPGQLRSDLFVRLTENAPSIDDVKYMHEHLPVDDRVMTRMITSFLQNRGASNQVYTKAQRDEIEAYFYKVDDPLYYRFQEIVDYRDNQRKARLREKGANRLQKLAEGFEGEVGGEKTAMENGPPATTSKVEKSASTEGKSDGRRRDRRKKNEKGKGVNGKASVSV